MDEGLRTFPFIENVCLYCDYIFLDTDERRRFAQVSHEYLIHQVQYNGVKSVRRDVTDANVNLRFNHPVKEIVWVVQEQERQDCADTHFAPFNYNLNGSVTTTPFNDCVSKAVLQLNGHDRFKERDGTYFRTVQPYQHHTGFFDNGQTSGAERLAGCQSACQDGTVRR